MQKHLNFFVRYDEEDNVVPMSLVKMRGFPQMPGKWKQVRSVCCDPSFEKFVNNSTEMKAWLIIDHKGVPQSGPILRKHRPVGVFSMQIQYNACCDANALLPVITTQPTTQTVTEGDPFTLTVVATGSNLFYQWYLGGVAVPGANDPSLTYGAAAPENAGVYFVRVYSGTPGEPGTTHVDSQNATITVNP